MIADQTGRVDERSLDDVDIVDNEGVIGDQLQINGAVMDDLRVVAVVGRSDNTSCHCRCWSVQKGSRCRKECRNG